MFRTIALAALGAALLAVPAPPALAASSVVHGGCHFAALSQATATGQDSFSGAAAGVVVATDRTGLPAGGTLRCYVTVDGVEQSSTTPQHGTGILASGGPVGFTAPEGSVVVLCAEVAFDDGSPLYRD